MAGGSHGRFFAIICLEWLPQAFLVLFLVPQPYNIKGKSIDGTWVVLQKLGSVRLRLGLCQLPHSASLLKSGAM